jgi:AmiR/NasT family two-component response regulator
LEALRRDLEAELSDLSKRIEELKRTAQGKG